jgi:hypothetical protein
MSNDLIGQDEVTYEIRHLVPQTILLGTNILSRVAPSLTILLPAFLLIVLGKELSLQAIQPSSFSPLMVCAGHSYGAHMPSFNAVEVKYRPASELICVTIYGLQEVFSLLCSLSIMALPRSARLPLYGTSHRSVV